jgi:hypothetical protein
MEAREGAAKPPLFFARKNGPHLSRKLHPVFAVLSQRRGTLLGLGSGSARSDVTPWIVRAW